MFPVDATASSAPAALSAPVRPAALARLFLRSARGLGASALAWIVPAALLGAWAVASRYELVAPQILPAPVLVKETFVDLVKSGDLLSNGAVSFGRMLGGFGIGSALGLALGVAMGLSRRVEEYVAPLFKASSQIPILAWIPLAMMLVGIGEALKVVIITKAAFIPLAVNTAAGIRDVPASYVEVARVLRFPRGRLLRKVILPATAPAIFTGLRHGLWWIVGRFQLANEHLLAPPAKVLAAARAAMSAGALWGNLGASVLRDLVGFVVGAVAGVAVGAALGLSRLVDRLLGPTLHAGKQVAIFAWIPLISVWFGFGEPAKIVFVALAAFYPLALNTYQGVRAVAPEHVEVARVFRLSRWRLLRRVIVPSALPSLCAGLRLALIYSWLATIGAEYFMAAGPGIGHLMIDGREQLRMELVLLGMVFVGLVGFALDAVASGIEARLLRWRRAAF